MKWPHESVSESGKLYPKGQYKLRLTHQEDSEAGRGQAMIRVDSRIMEGPDGSSQFKSAPFTFNFTIGVAADTAAKLGIEEDLAAENDETWTANPSARRYKSYLAAAGVASTGDTSEEAEDIVNKIIFVDLDVNGKFNEITAFYPDNGNTKVETKPTGKEAMNGSKPLRAAPKPRAQAAPEAQAEADDGWE